MGKLTNIMRRKLDKGDRKLEKKSNLTSIKMPFLLIKFKNVFQNNNIWYTSVEENELLVGMQSGLIKNMNQKT